MVDSVENKKQSFKTKNVWFPVLHKGLVDIQNLKKGGGTIILGLYLYTSHQSHTVADISQEMSATVLDISVNIQQMLSL